MRRFLPVSTVALATALFLAGCASTTSEAPSPSAPTAAEVPTQLPRNVRPLRYSISIMPDAANLRFGARAAIDIEVVEATETITLNAAELDFEGAALIPYSQGTSIPPEGLTTNEIRVDAEAQTARIRIGLSRHAALRACAVGAGEARTIILDQDPHARGFRDEADIGASGIAHGVLDQVADDAPQPVGTAAIGDPRARLEADRLADLDEVVAHAFHERGQVDRARGLGTRLLPRQRER